jgi:hypothetical protein
VPEQPERPTQDGQRDDRQTGRGQGPVQRPPRGRGGLVRPRVRRIAVLVLSWIHPSILPGGVRRPRKGRGSSSDRPAAPGSGRPGRHSAA